MTPERWKAVESLFDACVSEGTEARQTLLDTRRQDDPDLVREVEALLDEAARTGALNGILDGRILEGPRRDVLASLQDSLGAPGPGDLVGAYRLEALIGEGGMGKVYRARRDDDEFDQRVAVKLLPPGGASRGLEARFRAERQILAGLEHPHIARLLDGGTTVSGHPYLVMEYVDGEALLDFCDRRRLGIRARLRIFLEVASAVEYAHRHLVVHRDLKPANILVHPESGPKLLDFGIAKMLQPPNSVGEGAGQSVDLTLPQERMLTPDYASPEQILGQPVTTASDVYSLGVLLYELLTGTRPRQLRTLSPAARERALTDTSPTRPSDSVYTAPDLATEDDVASYRGLRPRQLARTLQGDLDTITLHALDTDSARRYGSVAELSADVERHLRGEAVLARPDGWRYRFGKLVGRHPWGTAAITAIVLLLAMSAAVLARYSARVAAQRDRALMAEARAQTVSDFLLELFEVADPGESRGETVTARELLDRGSALIETRLEDQPAVQAALLSTLADVHLNLGLAKRAELLHRLSLARRRTLLGDDHAETAASRDRLGDTLRQLSRVDDAETELRRALATREATLSPDDPVLADSLNNLGLLLTERGRYDEAEPLLRRGFEIRRSGLGRDHRLTDVSRSNLGQLLLATRRYVEASTHLEVALENRIERYGENHPKVANSMHVLATLRHRQGHMPEAERLFTRAIRIRRAVLPPMHPGLSASLNNLASLLHDQMRLEEAEVVYREAIEIDRQAEGARTIGLAHSLNNLGSLLEDRGHYTQAASLYEESLNLRRAVYGEGSRSYRRMLSNLGRLAIRMGDLETAEARLTTAAAWLDANLDVDEPDRIRTLERIALLRRERGDYEASESLLRDAAARAANSFRAGHSIHTTLLAELVSTLAASDDPSRCMDALHSARDAMDADAGEITRGRIALADGQCLRALGQDADADEAFREAKAFLEPSLGARNHWVRAAASR